MNKNKERIESEDNHNDSIIKSLHLSSIFYNNDNYNMIYKADENHEKAIREYKLNYLLNKVKQISEKNKEDYDKMITELPKFESDFELIHPKFPPLKEDEDILSFFAVRSKPKAFK